MKRYLKLASPVDNPGIKGSAPMVTRPPIDNTNTSENKSMEISPFEDAMPIPPPSPLLQAIRHRNFHKVQALFAQGKPLDKNLLAELQKQWDIARRGRYFTVASNGRTGRSKMGWVDMSSEAQKIAKRNLREIHRMLLEVFIERHDAAAVQALLSMRFTPTDFEKTFGIVPARCFEAESDSEVNAARTPAPVPGRRLAPETACVPPQPRSVAGAQSAACPAGPRGTMGL